jgi:hypothetical protein
MSILDIFHANPNPSSVEETKPVLVNEFSLVLHSGAMHWRIDPWEGTNRISPWIPFYRWYFDCKSSPAFVMKDQDGETMIRRSSIVYWTVTIRDKCTGRPCGRRSHSSAYLSIPCRQ